MAARTQRWQPDTCECVVIEQFDDALLELPHTLHNYERKCKAHAHLNDAAAFTAMTDDNQLKNRAWNAAVEQLGVTHDEIAWTFDDARSVILKPASADHDRAALERTLVQQFGARVTVR